MFNRKECTKDVEGFVSCFKCYYRGICRKELDKLIYSIIVMKGVNHERNEITSNLQKSRGR